MEMLTTPVNPAPLAQDLHHARVKAAVADLHLLEGLNVHVDHDVLPDDELHGAGLRVAVAQDGKVTQVHPAPLARGQTHNVDLKYENVCITVSSGSP